MGDLVGFLRQRLVVEILYGVGIEAEVELVLPADVEAGAGQRVVTKLRRRVSSVVTLPCRPWSLAHGPTARPDPGETIAPCRG